MKEPLVNHQTSTLAKKVGFNWQCSHFYYGDQKLCEYDFEVDANQLSEDNFGYGITSSAPQQSFLQKWLREVHNIIVEVTVFSMGWFEDGKFAYKVWIFPDKQEEFTTLDLYKTWEEALEAGLQEGLKLVKDKKNDAGHS